MNTPRSPDRDLTFAVDSGGTHTRLVVCRTDGSRSTSLHPTLNPSSTSRTQVDTSVAAIIEVVVGELHTTRGSVLRGVVANAAITPQSLPTWIERFEAALAGHRVDARIGLMNDEEYLGSDECSGFSLGRAGLVAAVRAHDQRGASTTIADRLASASECSVGELARRLAEQPFPKQAVAALAPAVLDAWIEDVDEVATGIVDSALSDLSQMVEAACRRSDESLSKWVLTGGLVSGSPQFSAAMQSAITAASHARCTFTIAPDATSAALALAAGPLQPDDAVPVGVAEVP